MIGNRRLVRQTIILSQAVLLLLLLASRLPAQDRDNCLYCHQFPGLARYDETAQHVRVFYVDPSYVHSVRGPHARLACTDCHNRDEVAVVPHRESTPVDCARQCHLVSRDAPERRFSHENIARTLDIGLHNTEVLRSLEVSGGALLRPGQSLCLYCHDEPLFRDPLSAYPQLLETGARAFDRCDVCHATEVPLDTHYYLRHVSARLSSSRSTLEMAQVCAVCHSDPRVLETHDMTDAVASFVRSFHGKAALLGDATTANCLHCHVKVGENAHLMRKPTDPLSAVNPASVADSCRSTACHPGADKAIASTAVHLDLPTAWGTFEYALAFAFIILTVISFGPSAVIVLLELAQLVIGRHPHHAPAVRAVAEEVLSLPRGRKLLQRFAPRHRIQHWLLTVTFILLCLTGFPLKFADQRWAAGLIELFGGLSVARFVHHWAGLALVAGFGLHLLDVLLGVLRRAWTPIEDRPAPGFIRTFMNLPFVISPADLVRVNQLMAYLLGLRRERPMFGRFSAPEKFEYFGVMWGTTLLGITGAMLWGEQITSHFLGGRSFNIASIIHTYEAFLAVIHVGILHIYNVVLAPAVFPLSLATLTGQTPIDKLAEEHGEFVMDAARELGLMEEDVGHA